MGVSRNVCIEMIGCVVKKANRAMVGRILQLGSLQVTATLSAGFLTLSSQVMANDCRRVAAPMQTTRTCPSCTS